MHRLTPPRTTGSYAGWMASSSATETGYGIPSTDNADDRFMVWAEAAGHDKPLIMTDLPPARLFDDIVVPERENRRCHQPLAMTTRRPDHLRRRPS